MPKGIWIWPTDPRRQRKALRMVAASPHLMAGISAIAKSKDGLSNAQLTEALSDGSEWTTLWVVRQLIALGFIEFKVDFFGNPATYHITEQGRAALSTITGQSLPKPASPAPVVTQPTARPATPAQPAAQLQVQAPAPAPKAA